MFVMLFYLRYKEKKFIVPHSFGGFSPWSTSPLILDLWQDNTSQWQHGGKLLLITREWQRERKSFWGSSVSTDSMSLKPMTSH
jgi:hypothetical protein